MIPEKKGAKSSMKIMRGLSAFIVLLLAAALFVGCASAAETLQFDKSGAATATISGITNVSEDTAITLKLQALNFKAVSGKNIAFNIVVTDASGTTLNYETKSFGATMSGFDVENSTVKIGGVSVKNTATHDIPAMANDITIEGEIVAPTDAIVIEFTGKTNQSIDVDSIKVKVTVSNAQTPYNNGEQLIIDCAAFGITGQTYTPKAYVAPSEDDDDPEPTPVPTVTPTTTPTEEPTPAPVEPVVPVTPVEEEDGTTVLTPTKPEDIVLEDDGTTAVIEATDGVSMKVTFEEPATKDEKTGAVTGTVNTVVAEYEEKPAETPEDVGKVDFAMDIEMDKIPATLPKIDPAFNPDVEEKVKQGDKHHKPLAMITASNADDVNEILKDGSGKGIKLSFFVPQSALSADGRLVVLHVSSTGEITVTESEAPTSVVKDGVPYFQITAYGDSFSSYVVVEDTTPVETPTETETPTPTETPSSPGFGVLAVLAGLGAVAALRRN